eukprot:3132048-Karenia_brevis.AAC.1
MSSSSGPGGSWYRGQHFTRQKYVSNTFRFFKPAQVNMYLEDRKYIWRDLRHVFGGASKIYLDDPTGIWMTSNMYSEGPRPCIRMTSKMYSDDIENACGRTSNMYSE